MAKKPYEYEWPGFTSEQGKCLSMLDHVGNNGWAKTSQTKTIVPMKLGELKQLGVDIEEVKAALAGVGYDHRELHQLTRWENFRKTGKLGP